MTFRERVEMNPVGWLVGVGAACFFAGLVVMGTIIQVIISDRGPRDKNIAQNPIEPSRAPTFQLPVIPIEAKNPSPIRSATPTESGNMELTIQQFVRRYWELDGRFAEQEAFLKRADRKRVRWKAIFTSPASFGDSVTAYFDVPSESPDQAPLSRGPLRWANFPASFHDRVYALKRGDTIEISGILETSTTNVVIRADDFEIVTAPNSTPTP